MRDMWEDVRLSMTFGAQNQNHQDNKQRQLLNSLSNGQTDLLWCELASALQQISADGRRYSQQVQLEFICRSLVSKLTTVSHTRVHRSASLEYNAQFLVDPQFDTPWTVVVLPFGRYIHAVALTFNFVKMNCSNKDGLDVAAKQALSRIGGKNAGGQHMHVGVAIGKSTVAVKQA
ncbi:hypothetical protein IWW36_006137 [Coemansia brasiliensis]|uniref:Uncharacterized protein n=1 Tax=Coemansia brasiliensis TaxID=2650707 RepID=A0A9W8I7C8_9FUNG|nr:hypothetical protein IWW36_006137 [Coemansia brasiliensis]